jgi:hypothetical protein
MVVMLAAAQVSAGAEGFLLLTEADAAAVKGKKAAGRAIRSAAEKAMKEGPWSVTFHRPQGTPAGPNDFYSEGPYWWPDPKNPGGPYIRRDGETNHDRFVANDRDQNAMCAAAAALGMGAWLFDEPRYNKRLQEVLRVWFLNQKTRMNPHLEYGQAVRGRNHGRGAGLIETRPYIWLIQGVLLAETAPGWDPRTGAEMRRWFGEYLSWFTTSEKGKQEVKAGNNHSTWWAAQVASFAVFARDAKTQAFVWDLYRDYLLGQFQADGSAPKEEARTRSLAYSAMNLDAFGLLCRMAQVQGVDLWQAKSPNGASIVTAMQYLLPYVTKQKPWTKPQITPYEANKNYFLALAAVGLKDRSFAEAQRGAGLDGGAHASLLALMLD